MSGSISPLARCRYGLARVCSACFRPFDLLRPGRPACGSTFASGENQRQARPKDRSG